MNLLIQHIIVQDQDGQNNNIQNILCIVHSKLSELFNYLNRLLEKVNNAKMLKKNSKQIENKDHCEIFLRDKNNKLDSERIDVMVDWMEFS